MVILMTEEIHTIALLDAEVETDGEMMTIMMGVQEVVHGIEEILGIMIEDTMAMVEGLIMIGTIEIETGTETMEGMELPDTLTTVDQLDMQMTTIEDCLQLDMLNQHQSCKGQRT